MSRTPKATHHIFGPETIEMVESLRATTEGSEKAPTVDKLGKSIQRFSEAQPGSPEQQEAAEQLASITGAMDKLAQSSPPHSRFTQLWQRLRFNIVSVLLATGLGAGIGSIVPVIGTAVGAVVGASIVIGGLFGRAVGEKKGNKYAEKREKAAAAKRQDQIDKNSFRR